MLPLNCGCGHIGYISKKTSHVLLSSQICVHFYVCLSYPLSPSTLFTLHLVTHSSSATLQLQCELPNQLANIQLQREWSLICVLSDLLLNTSCCEERIKKKQKKTKQKRQIETTNTTEATVWAKRSFGYVPGSDQAGGRCCAPMSSVYLPSGCICP